MMLCILILKVFPFSVLFCTLMVLFIGDFIKLAHAFSENFSNVCLL